jgi:predicted nucleic acid-binding protein
VFLDTNILVYAHDSGAGEKHELAAQLVSQIWENRSGSLSTQVLQEFYVSVRRKAAHPISVQQARTAVADYLTWNVVVNGGESILGAVDLERLHRLSFWDALILQAALESESELLLSEDFQHGRRFGELRVVNPFDS